MSGGAMGSLRRHAFALLPCEALALLFLLSFSRLGPPELFAGALLAGLCGLTEVLRRLAFAGTSAPATARYRQADVLMTLTRLSWVSNVVLVLVGLHAVTAGYDHDMPGHERNAPMHALGWLVLAAAAVLAIGLVVRVRRDGRSTALVAATCALFVVTTGGAVAAADREQDVRNTIQPCACFLP
ncbi:MAG: hypothetical protein ACXVYU_17490 [Oryzihumus sp.]